MQRAWRRASELGVYHFASSLVERSYAAVSLAAKPQEHTVSMDGDADLPARKLTLRLWTDGDSAATGAEMLIDGDKAYTRRVGGGTWQPVEGSTGSFAPDSDLLSYLAGIKNVQRLGEETRSLPGGGVRFTRYSFDMDGPALATYMRDRLEEALRAQGKLPLGVTLSVSEQYRDLTGQGEIWLGEAGLPLRLSLHLVYPPGQNGAHSEADIQTDFSGYPAPVAAPSFFDSPVDWAGALASGPAAKEVSAAGRWLLMFAGCLALAVLVVAGRRSRRVYVSIAIAVILAMAIVPLMQNMQVSAYMGEQAQQQAKAAESQRAEQKAQELAAQQASWNPHQDPLAVAASAARASAPGAAQRAIGEQQPLLATATPVPPDSTACNKDDTTDGDKDGLTNYQECLYGTNNSAEDLDEDGVTVGFDTDSDGLGDGQEVNYLGTNPELPDTDGDMIADTLEVKGFVYPAGGQHWYLDPRNPDTNGDGIADGIECPPLREGDTSEASITAECDTDADDVPNLFEDDNDDDKVPDKVDISPNQLVDQSGVRTDVKGYITAFNSEHPFTLALTGMQQNWPFFLDLQLRPETAKHLTYAMNVLDWPKDDDEGQIERVKETTWADTDNDEVRQEDDAAAAYGDMRLIPTLQIEMKGSSLPLKLTTPAITATLGSGTAVSATVAFRQDTADATKTHIAFTFDGTGDHTVKIFGDGCPGTGSPLWTATGVGSGDAYDLSPQSPPSFPILTTLADGDHALAISDGTTSVCADIPNIVNGPYTDQMVDESVLEPYGIGLREVSADPGTPVIAYVPLSTVSDDTGGGRTAFSARMPYWIGGKSAWTEAQEMRVSWVIQALTDSCELGDFPASLEEAREAWDDEELTQEEYDEKLNEHCLDIENRSVDELQVIQTYDEPFHVTGLTVTEDHGLDVAVAYPAPPPESNPGAYDENPLWQLAWGLGQMWIPGRDCEDGDSIKRDPTPDVCRNDGKRDLTVFHNDSRGNPIGNSTIYERWGAGDVSWDGSDALWGITRGSIVVEGNQKYRYDTSDYLAYMATTVTPAILEKFPHGVSPTLLFAREERYRTAGLEAATTASGMLTMGLGSDLYAEQTLASMNWAPFRYNEALDPDGNTIGWEAYPIDEYYETLDDDLKAYFTEYMTSQGVVVDSEVVAAQAAVADAYYVSVYMGAGGLVDPCLEGEEEEEEGEADEEIIEAAEKAGDVMIDITGEIFQATVEGMHPIKTIDDFFDLQKGEWAGMAFTYKESVPAWKSLGHALTDYAMSPWKTCFTGGAAGKVLGVGMGLVLAGAVATVILTILLGEEASDKELIKTIFIEVGLALNVISAMTATGELLDDLTHEEGMAGERAAEGAGEHAMRNKVIGACIRMVAQDLLLWACWGLSWALGGMAAGSMAWDAKLSETVAWTVTALLMMLVALIPVVGPVIVAVIGAIDALCRTICGIFLSEEQLESTAADWLCGGITGIVSKVIGGLIYGGYLLPIMDPEDFERLELFDFDASDLLYPDHGVTVGNSVRYSTGVTNTLELASQPSSMVSVSAGSFWDTEHLAHSNFRYEWQTEEEDIHSELALGGIPDPGWYQGPSWYSVQYTTTRASDWYFPLPEAGINRPVEDLYLSEGYAIPEAECWGLGIIAGCSEKSVKDTAHYPFGESVKFDVLPADLDGFYNLTSTEGGYRLEWDEQFPALTDADGDGLPYSQDPNDSLWDTDDDGLSDYYEITETGTDAAQKDSDKDGLTDRQEAQLGTDPRSADSDADGLYDCQEVFHRVVVPDDLATPPTCGESGTWYGGWDFVAGLDSAGAQLWTRVSSDPTDGDADVDNYPDAREKVYGFHPGVPSQSEILSLDSEMTETGPDGQQVPTDNYVAPGAKLQYTASVKNQLDAREAEGLLSTEGASVLDQTQIPPESFLLMSQEEKAIAGSLGIGTGASGVYSLTQVAGAEITDWRELSGDADLWLRFDDDSGATTYLDTSGNIPSNDGQCVDRYGNPATGPCTILTAGGKSGSAVQLNGQGYVRSGAAVNDNLYSYVLWFKTPSTAGKYTLLATDNAWGPVLALELNSDGTEYLKAFEPYAGNYGFTSWHSSVPYLADGNWHQVAVTCDTTLVRIHVDGSERSSDNSISCAGGGPVRVGGTSPNSYFATYGAYSGQIDDLRLYPTALTGAQVGDLYNAPVFRMNFDQQSVWQWKDVSSFGTPITVLGQACWDTVVGPCATSNGAVGWGGKFGTSASAFWSGDAAGGQPLSVGGGYPNDQLDLSGGKFTLSAWLKPVAQSTCRSYLSPLQDEYILGLDPNAGSYPSLVRGLNDTYTVFAFTPAGYSLRQASGPSLPLNTWSHFVVTYDKDGAADTGLVRFYLNGELRSTQPFGNSGEHPHPLQGSRQFYIGAAKPFSYNAYVGNVTNGFCGHMDEVQIFSHVLTDDAVKDLMYDSATGLRLALDEAPGATAFADDSTVRHAVSCSDLASCPVSGVDGRVDRGVQFDGSNDHLVLNNSEINSFNDRITAAAWVQLDTVAPQYQVVAGTVPTKSDNGWSFGAKGSELYFTTHGVKEYVSTGAALQTGRWYHVAAAFDAVNSKTVQFYLNGAALGSPVTVSSAGQADTDDQLYVGGYTVYHGTTPSNQWHGSIDDLLIFHMALSGDRIRRLYSQAPAMDLRFEDAQGATSFANTADAVHPGTCTGDACPLTGEGIKGQVGLAAQFDGSNDQVAVPQNAGFDTIEKNGTVTVAAWVNIHQWYNGWFLIVDKYKSSGDFGWNFQVHNTNGLNFMASLSSGTYCKYVPPLDQWVHLAVTYDKTAGKARYYVNGALQCDTALNAALTDTADGPVYVGYNPSGGDEWSNGRLDQVKVYDHALAASDIHDMFVYENGWVEDRESRNLTLDADNPTAAVKVTDPAYQANWPAEVLVTAEDNTSPVDTVRLCVGGNCSEPAPRCAEPNNTAWCPTFDPTATGQGVYTLSAAATDRVGHSGTSPSQPVYVDDSAPQVTMYPSGDSWYTASEYQGQSNTWAVRFAGTVFDPDIANGVPGVGIPANGVRVTLYRQDGGVVSTGTQTATVSSGAWSLYYLLADADPSGCYRASVQAVDTLAQQGDLPPSQKERHTATLETAISIDADPAPASVDWINLPAGQLGPAASVVKGGSSAEPVPVVLTFTGGANSAQSQVVLTCQHGNQGSWWTPYSSQGDPLEPGRVVVWGEEGKDTIHHLSTCEVRLTTTADTDDLSGNVSVCGEQILQWSGDFTKAGKTYSFVVDSPGCTGGEGCPVGAQKATAGVKGVDVSFLPLTPGSTLFNDIPPSGQLLHLTMDAGQDTAGNLTFPDASGHNLTGTCSGSACPMVGQQGHGGQAALFDGSNDYITAGSNTTLKLTTAGSIAFWIYPTVNKNAPIVNREGEYEIYRYSDGTIRYALANTSPGWVFVNTGYTAPLNQWTHVVVTFDSGTVWAYANGAGSYTATYTGSIGDTVTNMNELRVGGRQYNADRFAGLIDDVRIFNRGLSASEVKAQYQGSGPLLVLPFEERWAADGLEQKDASGWARDATLHTSEGAAAGKAVDGQAGRYALRFDGVDDYVSMSADASLDLSAGRFTEAAWIYPELTDGGYHGFVGYEPATGEKQRYPGLWLHSYNRVVAGFGDGTYWNALETPVQSQIQNNKWSHVASTFDGTRYIIYLNGTAIYTSTAAMNGRAWSSSKPYPVSEGLWAGKTETKFRGRLDDVRVYPRALGREEIQAVYLSGWQAASITPNDSNSKSAQWQLNTPKWLEGSYRIEARGWDAAGHTSPPRGSAQTWSGEADTLGPRVTLTRSTSGSLYQYKMTAQDYNLTLKNLVTPCPSSATVVTTTFQSPWYVAAVPTIPRLYQLSVDCTVSSSTGKGTACDTFGNCTTVSATVTGAAAASAASAGDAETRGPAPKGDSEIATTSPLLPLAASPMQPALSFAPTVITTTHLSPRSVVDITGLVTNTNVIESVVVSVGGVSGPATLTPAPGKNPLTASWLFPWPFGRSPLPDGVAYSAVATGTRVGGKPIVEKEQLLVDVVPPSQVPLALKSGDTALQPGDTVRSAGPELALSWHAATDGSGVAGYQARWTASSSVTTTHTTRAIAPGGLLEDHYTAGEAQKLTADLGSRDKLGNVRWQETGPVYVDSPLTPDYIVLNDDPYQGWQESGCSLLGADRRLERRAGGNEPQRLYATWDQAALRLAWTGATWNGDGDLFVYLDTAGGGTGTLYNPAGASAEGVRLTNDAMQSDYLVWVQDAHTATLLRWDGGAWATAGTLSEQQFRFDSGRHGGQTDLNLPFGLIGLGPGSPLGLLAVSSEEPVAGQELRLWAALPQFNPVNSPRVNPMFNFVPPEGAQLSLRRAYQWTAVGDGMCPNGSAGKQLGAHYGDVRPQLSIQSNPPGIGLNGLGRGLFWVPDDLAGNAGGLEHPFLHFAARDLAPVDVEQDIVYTVRYRNAGGEAHHGVRLVLAGDGVELDKDVVELGDVAPGAEVQVAFHGRVTGGGSNPAWAGMKGMLYDTAHPEGVPLDWLSMTHRVDQAAPDGIRIILPRTTVGPGTAALAGVAHDESAVARVDVKIVSPDGTPAMLPCTVTRPGEGRWACTWDVGGADGDVFTLWARATDVFGHTSDWSSETPVTVDAQPPEVRVPSPGPGAVLQGLPALFGSALDESGIALVRVCVDGECGKARRLQTEGSAIGWRHSLPVVPTDYVSKTITIDAMDRAGNRAQPLEFSFTQDNVAPALTASQGPAQLVWGERQRIFEGAVQDGGPGPRVFVMVRAPDGTKYWKNTARNGDQWWYELSGELVGRYTLWLLAIDRTGNTRTMGPYTVDVTCTDAALETTLVVEPQGGGADYLVTATVLNTGPAGLPAGVPMTLYAGSEVLGAPQTLPALANGESGTVSAVWTRPGPEGYAFLAIVNEPPAVVLCKTPATGRAEVIPEVDLRISKTVEPLAAAPGDVITYTLVYSNAGSGIATGVTITDTLPAELLEPTWAATGAAATLVPDEPNFAWTVEDLPSSIGGQIVISGTLAGDLTAPLTITNTAGITATLEGAPWDNVASVELPVEPAETPAVDLRISQTVEPAAAMPGEVITYTLTYINAGSGLATGVVITDLLPAEILAPAYQATGAAITLVDGSAAFSWQVADLAGGQGGQIVISGMLDPAVTTPVTITNVVTITAPLEAAPGDNVASVELAGR